MTLGTNNDMKSKTKLWLGLATLVASLAILILVALSAIGFGPNLGLPFGYYGKFNRVLGQIEGNPELEVIRTTLHRDMELEDFYITVRTQDEREVRLRFEKAHTRQLTDLLQELKKEGIALDNNGTVQNVECKLLKKRLNDNNQKF